VLGSVGSAQPAISHDFHKMDSASSSDDDFGECRLEAWRNEKQNPQRFCKGDVKFGFAELSGEGSISRLGGPT
jgi:hypothetical protein